MQLKYHQATYDLLTQKPINPQNEIDNYAGFVDSRLRGEIANGLNPEDARAKLTKALDQLIAWTTLDLYQRPVQFSKANVQKLDALEQKYKIKLPEAVREWYSLDIVPQIMSADGFGITDIEHFKPLREIFTESTPHRLREDLWYFLHHEYIDQGGEAILFKMDAGDNPPVVAEYAKDFIEVAPSFSEFMYLHFWRWHAHYTFDYVFSVYYHPGIKSMQALPKFHRPLAYLRKHYSEFKTNLVTYFYDEHTRIEVHHPLLLNSNEVHHFLLPNSTEYDRETMGGGEFRGDSVETLKNIIANIWQQDIPIFDITWRHNRLAEFAVTLRREAILYHLHQRDDWMTATELADELGSTNASQKSAPIKWLEELIANGEAEAHPDNGEKARPEQRFRAIK